MRHSIRPLRFTLVWVAAAVLLLPQSFLIWLPIGAYFVGSATLISAGGLADTLSVALAQVIVGTFAGATGWCIGALQQLIIKRNLHFELKRWREFSLLGGFVAGVVSSFVCLDYCVLSDINLLLVRSSMRTDDGLVLSMLLFLGILSSVQFLTLRRQASAAALWVIAHLVSVPLVYALWRNPLAAHFPYTESYLGVILALPVVAALVTAPIMLWIVSHSAAGDKAKRNAVASGNDADAPHETRVD